MTTFTIAICDDEKDQIEKNSNMLEAYSKYADKTIRIKPYLNQNLLYMDIQEGKRFDIILLDILMDGLNGMEIARKIREIDKQAKMIFLTTSPDFAVESYTVEAFYYLMKPVEAQKLFAVCDRALSEIDKREQNCILIHTEHSEVTIYADQLEYCEIVGRNIYYHMADKIIYQSTGTITQLEKQLAGFPCFLRVHRSFLVNMDYIKELNYKELVLKSSHHIAIPRGRTKEVRQIYMDYAFR